MKTATRWGWPLKKLVVRAPGNPIKQHTLQRDAIEDAR